MEQEIRYCTTADGVRIAYATVGEGRPAYVIVPGMYASLELDWEWDLTRQRYESLARTFTVLRYDKRGSGLSDRDITDYSVEARTSDLLAVIDAAGIERFILSGPSEAGPVAMSFAAQYPDRVARLILIGTYASGSALRRLRGEFGEAMIGLIRAEWSVASRTLGEVINPDVPPGQGAPMARLREAVSGEHVARMLDAMGRVEIEQLLPQITCPKLVVHGRKDKAIPFELGRRIAAAIPGARFHADDLGHMSLEPSRLAVLREFVAPELSNQAAPANLGTDDAAAGSTMSVILFTDVADSTERTERMGDTAFREASRALDDRLRAAIRGAGGTPVDGKLLGDGVMGVFASAARAIAAAQACSDAATSAELPLHIGLHAGDVIHEKDNVYGGAVNIASRICGLCAPGEILVSQTVRDLARTSAGVSFEDRGEHALKGIADPMRVFAIRDDRG